MTSRFRARYGAGPLHLLAILLSFAIAAYALERALGLTSNPDRIVIWLGGSIVAHDLVLFPLYALLGVLAAGVLLRGDRRDRLHVAALNHLRFPALLSGLALLVWYPLVAGPADRGFTRLTGLSKDVYFERWLLLSAALFAISAAIFALRLPRLRRAAGRPGRSPRRTA
ncbi:MAG: hypothetical protein ACRDN8_22655 [Thermoleophilaceae bacterium]